MFFVDLGRDILELALVLVLGFVVADAFGPFQRQRLFAPMALRWR